MCACAWFVSCCFGTTASCDDDDDDEKGPPANKVSAMMKKSGRERAWRREREPIHHLHSIGIGPWSIDCCTIRDGRVVLLGCSCCAAATPSKKPKIEPPHPDDDGLHTTDESSRERAHVPANRPHPHRQAGTPLHRAAMSAAAVASSPGVCLICPALAWRNGAPARGRPTNRPRTHQATRARRRRRASCRPTLRSWTNASSELPGLLAFLDVCTALIHFF